MKQLLFIFLTFFSTYSSCWPESAPQLVENGGYLLVSQSGDIIAQHNANHKFIPASIFKLLTSAAALEKLGPDYRFQTKFYLSPGCDLYITGYGDPFLRSEEISQIAQILQQKGLSQINNIYIDQSAYQLTTNTINAAISNNPYEAAISALGANFNTTQLTIDANAIVYSGEKQTPLLAITKELGQDLPMGTHRINLGKSQHLINTFVGQLFQAKFLEYGIKTRGTIKEGIVHSELAALYNHYSKPLIELIPDMPLYSNNYMANQLFLTIGAKQYHYPATWLKARTALYDYCRDIGIRNDIIILDGAGLDMANKISAFDMKLIVERLRRYRQLLPKQDGQLLKSGTMTGVYCYAGFINTREDSPIIILMLNQKNNNREELLKSLTLKVTSN